MITGFCLDCEVGIGLDPDTRFGRRFNCPHCGIELTVIDTSPLELDWACDEPESLWDSQDWD
jgi:transcription initiation factor IIE alpha subunit